MQFCPKCDNIMDIGKTVPKPVFNLATPETVTNTTDEKINEKINKKIKVEKIIELFKSGEDITKYNLDMKAITTNPEFNKLSETDKKSIMKILSNELDDMQTAFRICKNCSYHEKIVETTLILSRMNTNISAAIEEDYNFMVYDKTLPHTRDYKCKNSNCVTHKKPSQLDAVWFRPKLNSYATYYGCTQCKTVWNVS
jgi:hypothetical protein